MSHQRKQHRQGGVISPGSVALADILANSVAVIMILILATLVSRQQQAREEMERSTDITTILSRQLATTVVFNDLPSSPPSILHDYHSCDIPHDCNPMLYPIIEMHDGFLRIFNTNTRIYRAELLRPNNAFDRYLASLDPVMREMIRLDIHSVTEYYIILGIMQEHGLRSRHWHYLGEHVPPLAGSPLQESIAGIRSGTDEDEGLSDEDGDGEGMGLMGALSSIGDGTGSGGNGPPGLEGSQLGGADVLNALNFDSLLPPTAAAGRDIGMGSRSGGPLSQQRRRRPSIFDRGARPGPLGTRGQATRLLIPNAVVTMQQQGRPLSIPPEHYHAVVLSYLLKVLETAREFQGLELSSLNSWLGELVRDPESASNLPHYDLVQRLSEALKNHGFASVPQVESVRLEPRQSFNRLLIEPNVMEGEMTLHLDQPMPWVASAIDESRVQPRLLLRSYPSLFKGEPLEMPQGYMLLLLPDELESPDLAWRPVAIVDRDLVNIALGFLYAGAEDGRLALHAGVNQLQLNGRPATNFRVSAEDRTRNLPPMLWILALLGVLILLWLASRRWFRQKDVALIPSQKAEAGTAVAPSSKAGG